MKNKNEILTFEHLISLNKVWSTLNESQRVMLMQIVKVKNYKKNTEIHHDGVEPDNAMFLLEGKVKICREGNSQREQIFRMLKPGALFAYRAIIANEIYNACAMTVEQCLVVEIPKEFFMSLLRDNSKFCFHILQQMACDLNQAEVQTLNLTQKHIRGRLAEAILSLLDQYGLDEDQSTIAMYMSREDLANMSNMITANAIRTLSDFAKEGLVAVDGRKIKILDEEKLRHISKVG